MILLEIRIALQRAPDKIPPQTFMNTIHGTNIHLKNRIRGHRLQGIKLPQVAENTEPHDQTEPQQKA